ncbi:DUF6776 family protein [Isoalcanivorax indicus]|uniref:DUF6776 family protein n=1 Tax=Isoalcanivorax indicus TaxID=2202653 RepID=UPI000DBA49F9|nr:DUF6776 family protein [Isoalcanivorax indicus]
MPGHRRKKRSSELTLMPVDLRRQTWVRALLSLVAVLAVVLAFFGGYHSGGSEGWATNIEQQRLKAKVKQLESALREARDELVLHRTGSEVTYQAQEQVRQELRGLRDQIAELEEAAAFYKNVMSPGAGEQGLRIERFELSATDTPGVFSYRLVLTQVGDNSNFIAGDVSMTLDGQQDGNRITVSGNDLISQDDSTTQFRFRYFQELSGRLELPGEILPRNITVEAVASGRGGQRTERQFGWQLQERDSARAG